MRGFFGFRSVPGRLLLAGLAVIWSCAAVFAHPHVFVQSRSEVVFDKNGNISGIRHIWRFDEAYSAFAMQGLDADGDNKLTVDELQPLAKVNVDSLKDFDFFTYLTVGDKEAAFQKPTEYWLDAVDGRLTLFFTLPLEKPATAAGRPVALEVYDQTYFVDFAMTGDTPVTLDAAPAGCSVTVKRPKQLDSGVAATLAQIPSTVRELPKELMDITKTLSNAALITCD